MIVVVRQVFVGWVGWALVLLACLSLARPAAAGEVDGLNFSGPPYLMNPADYAERVKAVNPAPPPAAMPYEVQAGDTFYRISRSFGLTVETLLAANQTVRPASLTIGQRLTIPVREAGIAFSPDSVNGRSVKQVINSTLTAYTAGVESTGKTPSSKEYGITYSGLPAEEGRTIAVDPEVIPIGATVFIDGIGLRTAEDIGSAIRGSRIDIFMNDLKQARQFGVKKNVKVYVLQNGAA